MSLSDLSLGQLARDIPGATTVFHALKLDFCCGGHKSLREAALKRGLDLDDVIRKLEALKRRQDNVENWAEAPNDALIEHILNRYHDVHREQLPELIRLAQRVERVHGGHPQCPAGLSAHLEAMLAELENHMQKEEGILFPMIARGITGMAAGPVSVMRHEHDDHGAALERIGELTCGITLPDGACNTWRALYLGLSTLQNDLMDHIHLENNVLFNRIDGHMGGAQHG